MYHSDVPSPKKYPETLRCSFEPRNVVTAVRVVFCCARCQLLSKREAFLGVTFSCNEDIRVRFRCFVLPCFGSAAEVNPVNKVVQLLTDLEAKIKAEGAEAHRVHEEFTAWCKTQSSDLTFAVQTGLPFVPHHLTAHDWNQVIPLRHSARRITVWPSGRTHFSHT